MATPHVESLITSFAYFKEIEEMVFHIVAWLWMISPPAILISKNIHQSCQIEIAIVSPTHV